MLGINRLIQVNVCGESNRPENHGEGIAGAVSEVKFSLKIDFIVACPSLNILIYFYIYAKEHIKEFLLSISVACFEAQIPNIYQSIFKLTFNFLSIPYITLNEQRSAWTISLDKIIISCISYFSVDI